MPEHLQRLIGESRLQYPQYMLKVYFKIIIQDIILLHVKLWHYALRIGLVYSLVEILNIASPNVHRHTL